MRRRLLVLVALITLASGRTGAAAPSISPTEARSILNRYCVSCHNDRMRPAVLALDVDTASLLPPDDSSSGFDNNADVLGVSPSPGMETG